MKGNRMDDNDPFLNLVDFKRLMAGMGWWVDLSRMQSDIGYTNDCLQRTLRSDSELLQQRSVELLGLQSASACCDAAAPRLPAGPAQ
jgi:hypothetical protein